SGDSLYGTARGGGSSGTVFKVNTDGTGFTNLYRFTARNYGTNSDGAYPYAGLILSGDSLYGMAQTGGSSGKGTVFEFNTNGTSFTTLHSFTGLDGNYPTAGLILSGNTLYGTAQQGGSGGNGTVFKVKTDATGFTNLYSFTSGNLIGYGITNSDGANPHAEL